MSIEVFFLLQELYFCTFSSHSYLLAFIYFVKSIALKTVTFILHWSQFAFMLHFHFKIVTLEVANFYF